MDKQAIENALATLQAVQEGTESIGEQLDRALSIPDEQTDRFVIDVIRMLKGVRYGLDKLEAELLS